MFPPQKPQPSIELPEPTESPQLKRWQNVSNAQFLFLNLAIGLTASTFARPYPKYLALFLIGTAASGLALMFFPIDKNYRSLLRFAGLAFYVGAGFAWWDLLTLLQWWHFAVAGAVAILGLFAIGSGGSK